MIVDIVCLVHNQLEVTKGFVEFLFKNTPRDDFRLIFFDNGSDEETQNYLQSGKEWEYVRSDKNLGIIDGRNAAAKYTKNKYFINLDNDQYVQSGWLDSLLQCAEKGYDLIGAEAWLLCPPDTKTQIVCGDLFFSRAYFPLRRCTKKTDKYSYVGCGGMLIPRRIYQEIGLFDPVFNPAYFEDPDFCFRCIENGYKIYWDYNCKINHLAHRTTKNQTLFSSNSQFINSFSIFQEKWTPYYPGPFQSS